MLISPTEPAQLRSIGTVAMLPETYGCDVLFSSPMGLVGVQRKEVDDLVNSIYDGRLGQQLAQMKASDLYLTCFIIEGKFKWTNDGKLWGRSGLSQAQLRGIYWTIQSNQCWIIHSSNLDETIESLLQLEKWCQEHLHPDKVSSLLKKKVGKNDWGVTTNREYAVGLLMNFGLGPILASRIYDKFGCPVKWTVTKEELMTVPGIGKGRAEKMIKALGDE